MPAVLSKLYSQLDIIIENYTTAVHEIKKNNQSYRKLKDTVETCREIEKHWQSISKKFNNVDIGEIININELLNKSPWRNRLSQT